MHIWHIRLFAATAIINYQFVPGEKKLGDKTQEI